MVYHVDLQEERANILFLILKYFANRNNESVRRVLYRHFISYLKNSLNFMMACKEGYFRAVYHKYDDENIMLFFRQLLFLRVVLKYHSMTCFIF